MVISRRDDRQIIDVNDRWEALFGYRRADAVGRTMAELPLGAGAEDQATLRRLAEAPGPVRDVETRFVTRSGELRETIVATEAVEMGGHHCFIDHPRRHRAAPRGARSQEQRQLLTHLSRVAVLGELSGALAHELSQPLTAILSNAQAARGCWPASRSICARSTRSWRTSPAPTGAPARSSGACRRCSGARSRTASSSISTTSCAVLDLTAVISSRDTSR